MILFIATVQINLPMLTQPVFEVVGACVCLGIFALVIWGLIIRIRKFESMEGIWYCKERNMQISLTNPKNSFLVENGEKIQCRCDTYMAKGSRGVLEVYCQEMEHPQYTYGKTLFSAVILQHNKESMVVYDRKSGRQYTFTRTDKIG